MSEVECAAYDEADRAYQERHGDCRCHGWSMSGSRTWHCVECCPPHPLSDEQLERLAVLVQGSSGRAFF
jgi:hypothetical protein